MHPSSNTPSAPDQVECVAVGPLTLGALQELLGPGSIGSSPAPPCCASTPSPVAIRSTRSRSPAPSASMSIRHSHYPFPDPRWIAGRASRPAARGARVRARARGRRRRPTWSRLIAAGVDRDELEPAIAAQVLESQRRRTRALHPPASRRRRVIGGCRRLDARRSTGCSPASSRIPPPGPATSRGRPTSQTPRSPPHSSRQATRRPHVEPSRRRRAREQAVRLTPTDAVDASIGEPSRSPAPTSPRPMSIAPTSSSPNCSAASRRGDGAPRR